MALLVEDVRAQRRFRRHRQKTRRRENVIAQIGSASPPLVGRCVLARREAVVVRAKLLRCQEARGQQTGKQQTHGATAYHRVR